MNLCKVMLLGNVGADPRTSKGQNGLTAELRLAINHAERDRKTGALLKTTDWHTVVAVGKLAEIVAEYIRKGDRIYVEGTLRSCERDGNTHVRVVATNLIMLGGARESQ